MIKKLFIIAFFFYQISFSQTDSISLYYKKGEFRKAISYGELIISYYHDNKITKDEGFINTLSWLATLSDTDNDTIKREKYYKLLEENINIYGDNYKSIIQNYYLIGKNYKTKLKFDLAEDYFKKAISLSELNNFEEEVYFSSLQLLGQIYSDQEKIFFVLSL